MNKDKDSRNSDPGLKQAMPEPVSSVNGKSKSEVAESFARSVYDPKAKATSSSNPFNVLSELHDGDRQKTNYATDSDDDEVIFDEASNSMVDSIISEGASTPGNTVLNG